MSRHASLPSTPPSRAAARRSSGASVLPSIERCDLHGKVRAALESALIVFLVDTSGSMGARRRMEAAKGAILGLLGDAYRRRDQVAVVAFRGPQAEVVLAPSPECRPGRVGPAPAADGRSHPSGPALTVAAELIARENQEGPAIVVLLTDGKANVPLPGSAGDPGRRPWSPGNGSPHSVPRPWSSTPKKDSAASDGPRAGRCDGGRALPSGRSVRRCGPRPDRCFGGEAGAALNRGQSGGGPVHNGGPPRWRGPSQAWGQTGTERMIGP